MWRFIPFYLALIAAPLLFGGVKPESQAVLGILLSLGLILTNKVESLRPIFPRWLTATLIALAIIQILPLPFGVIKILSPERAALAVDFSIDGQVPAWLTFSTSPARTVQRLWELTLAAASFIIARRHAIIPGAKRRLAMTVSIALILLAASDIWSHQHGRTMILNIWAVSWGKGYGTFANHNHFANWIYVASLFTIGWTLRELLRRDRPPNRYALLLTASATAFALTMAFLSASRSGTIAFILALGAFVFFLRKNFQKRRAFALLASLVLLGAIFIGLLAAEPFLARLRSESTASALSSKAEIWKQTLQLATRFPIFGAGPGSFVRVFDHYKTGHGDVTFLHAENDFLELPLEFGFPFAILLFASLAFFAVKTKTDSPIRAGLAAALVLFLLHSSVEFISYIPANLILACIFAGALLGTKADSSLRLSSSAGIFRFALPLGLLVCAILQLTASVFAIRAFREENTLKAYYSIDSSLRAWPFSSERAIAHLRCSSAVLTAKHEKFFGLRAAIIKGRQDRALKLDPLNWNLRLEQTWFELAYSPNKARALSNAWLTVRLNPLQAQIPLRFARHFQKSDPDLALQFLGAADPTIPANHFATLDLAWTITHDPEQLWKLTPNTTNAIINLIHFATQKKIDATAAQACQALENRVPAETLARLYLEAHRADQAFRVVRNSGALAAQSLQIQALTILGRHAEAVAIAHALFSSPTLAPQLEQKIRPTSSYADLLKNHQANPTTSVAALQLAERIAVMTDPDISQLAALAAQFPNEPRIAYLLFQIQANNPPAAAQTAAALANHLVPM